MTMSTATTRRLACRASDVPDDEGYRLDLGDRPAIAIFKVDGQFYAIDDTCSHGDASLSMGCLQGSVVECPYHSGSFDVCTGKALTSPAVEPVRSYPTVVEGEDIYVLIEDA